MRKAQRTVLRAVAFGLWLGLVPGGLIGPSAAIAATAGAPLPVGYEHPESDQGGPTLTGGLEWLERVWPRYLKFTSGKLAGGMPTVMFITNPNVDDKVYSLRLRFPLDALIVAGTEGTEFAGRDRFYEQLRSRPRVDCFVLSRVHPGTIPADVQYEILRRVKDDGAGLAVIDLFDPSDTLNPTFLELKPAAKGTELIPGIPYEGLRSWDVTKETAYQSYNFWYGNLRSEPVAKPHRYGEVSVSPFGKGRVVWVSTNTHWQRYGYARTLLPHLAQDRSMWVETDYFYSHTVKAILQAAGRTPPVAIANLTPRGGTDGTAAPVVTVANPGGQAFAGVVHWQLRDTWAAVTASGTLPISIAGGGAEVRLDGVKLNDAGRQFLDVRLDNAADETVDWGSTFVDVDRGVAPPAIACKYPDGTPRGADLEGTVTATAAPAGARWRIALVDRYWREVGRTEAPVGPAPVTYRFPTAGLDGQIWRLQADVLGPGGHVLARNWLNVTSPHTRASRGGFHPVMTCVAGASLEEDAWREYLRRLGFLADRPYMPGNTLVAEAHAWNDLQLLPFFCAVNCGAADYRQDHISDWEDPVRKAELQAGAEFMTRQLRPFGHRGFNLTDDASPAPELPAGPYTAIAFHAWLKAEYGGDFEAVCRGWGFTPDPDPTPPDELSYDPYVAVEFHQWLKSRYGDLAGVARAWKLPSAGFGWLRLFGTIERDLITDLRQAGNPAPADDARRFMQEYGARTTTPNPWGRIHAASVKKAYTAGQTAAWMDAKRFLQQAWVKYMGWVRDAACGVNSDVVVGSDAGYYGQALADLFGTLDYIAPYYDDRAVKVAVSRGRLRRPGDFGACLGSYGEKPANSSGRRSQIWDVLFAGGNTFYYWMFAPNPGLNADLTPSDAHARYQCEVTEEIMGGIGELFTGCTRVFHPIMVLDSQTSGLCDELEAKLEPVSTVVNSISAFQYAFEDLGVNPHTITASELAGPWFGGNPPRLLVLPAAISLSDREIEAIREFATAGGVVVADVLPGQRWPNGNLRDDVPLADVFGVEFERQGKARRARAALDGRADDEGSAALAFGEALADPRVRPVSAQARGQVGETPALLVNRCGQGTAFLFNCSFASYATYRTEGGPHWQAWHAVLQRMVAAARIHPEFAWTSAGKATPGFEISAFRNGSGYLLGLEELGCGDFTAARRPVEVKLPATFHVYEMRSGTYAGAVDVIRAELPRNGHRAYALLPYRVGRVGLGADAQICRPGETVTLRLDVARPATGEPPLHVVRLDAVDPGGTPFFPFRRVLKLPPAGPLAVPLTFARNDPPGSWRFTATDINSRQTASLTLTLKGGPTP